jgi:hypothetical protein
VEEGEGEMTGTPRRPWTPERDKELRALVLSANSTRAAALSGVQDSKRTNDGVATAAAIVIFWPAAFFVGGDKQTAAELAQMKGQMVAIEQEANMKKCGIQFRRPRPPGT